jgi:chromosome transmission fidelity protein 1
MDSTLYKSLCCWDPVGFCNRDICYMHCRAVVLAGGTMQPLNEFRDQLFLSAGGTAERITEFSCGHVIPPESILPITLATGPSGKQLDFSYQTRTTLIMVS